MIRLLACWMGLIAYSASTGILFGDAVYLKNSSEPVFGLVVEQTTEQVVIRERYEAGKYVERKIPIEQVTEVVITIDRKVLSSIDANDPQQFADIADSFAAIRGDPEANDLAIRFYLISAWLLREHHDDESEKLRQRCLLGLVPLARNELEEARFRSMAFINVDHVGKDFLAPTKWKPQKTDDRKFTEDALNIVHQIRKSKGREVRDQLDDPQFKNTIKEFESICTQRDLVDAARVTQLTLEQMRRVIQLELKLGEVLKSSSASADVQGSWSSDVRRDRAAWLVEPRIETVTEFDPKQRAYRDGKWVEP